MTKVPLSAGNDPIDFSDPIEARRFIRGWVANFKRITGDVVTFVQSNAGYIYFDCMADEEALFVAKDLHRINNQAQQKRSKSKR